MIASEIITFILILSPCYSYKILGVFPSAAPSTKILSTGLMRGIADAGHDVTLISAFDDEYTPKNGSYRVVKLVGLLEELEKNAGKIFNAPEEEKTKRPNVFSLHGSSPYLGLFMVNRLGSKIGEDALKNENLQKLIHSGEKFDVVIVQQFLNDAMKGLANHFGAHLVVFSNVGLYAWINELSGNPSLPSYAPEVFLGYPTKMNFFQRVNNAVFNFVSNLFIQLLVYPAQKEMMKKYVPIEEDFYDVLYNVSFFLINSHVSVAHALPTVPNMAFIGGYHIKPPKKLPEDLQKFLDESSEGVVYFSMGSNLKSRDLPEDKRNALLKAFGKLKQKVLWKWEDETLPGQPENVKLSKWLPQNDVLAHPNIKVFITHGGYGSTLETVYHGVPVLAIPILADQNSNARKAEEMGYGIVMQFDTITEEVVSKALEEILYNPKYGETAKLKSKLFRDRPMTPMQEVVYWLEYVVKYNGAKHLRVVSLDLPWYQYYLLDVFAFFGALTFGSYYVVFKCRRR